MYHLLTFVLALILVFFYYFPLKSRKMFKAISGLILGWFIPGLGHLLARKYWKALIFFVCITLMASLGLIMGGKIYRLQAENPLTILAFFSDLGYGSLYFLSKLFSFGSGVLKKMTFEFGTTYIAGAGLLNYLVALDAFDILSGKKK